MQDRDATPVRGLKRQSELRRGDIGLLPLGQVIAPLQLCERDQRRLVFAHLDIGNFIRAGALQPPEAVTAIDDAGVGRRIYGGAAVLLLPRGLHPQVARIARAEAGIVRDQRVDRKLADGTIPDGAPVKRKCHDRMLRERDGRNGGWRETRRPGSPGARPPRFNVRFKADSRIM